MKSLLDVLMQRDGFTEAEALERIQEAHDELYERLAAGDMPFDICEEYFGLEPDYLEELM